MRTIHAYEHLTYKLTKHDSYSDNEHSARSSGRVRFRQVSSPSSGYSSILKTDTARSSEVPINICWTTRRHIPEDVIFINYAVVPGEISGLGRRNARKMHWVLRCHGRHTPMTYPTRRYFSIVIIRQA
jgi:hypothetical protein